VWFAKRFQHSPVRKDIKKARSRAGFLFTEIGTSPDFLKPVISYCVAQA
jgi:hypothetical protein